MKMFLSLLILCLVSCSNGETNKTRIRNKIASSVVTIFGTTQNGYSSGGTGFSVRASSGKLYLVTNKHVCELRDSSNLITVKFPNLSREYKRRVIEISTEHDLCLIESLPSFTSSLSVANNLEVGQDTYAVGHPRLYALTVSEGQYIQEAKISVRMSGSKKPTVVKKPYKIPFSVESNLKNFNSSRFVMYSRGGNSGSPIVNSNGEVISVLFAGNPGDNMETYGVPLRYLKSFLMGY